MHKVLVMGNSPMSLDHELGAEIDEFDEVIRMNNFEIEGYEKNIGSKTTIWANGTQRFDKNIDSYDDLSVMWAVYPLFTYDCNSLHAIKNCKLPLSMLTKEAVRDVHDDIGFPEKFPHPSTGILTIKMAMECYPKSEIFYHGFSFFEGAEVGSVTPHYFDDVDNKLGTFFGCHVEDKERDYVHKLEKLNKIKRLV